MKPEEIDSWEQKLDHCIRTGKCNINAEDYPQIAKALVGEEGGKPRIAVLKSKFLRCHDIMNEHDSPDPPAFPPSMCSLMEDAYDDDDKLDWHKVADIIAGKIKFVNLQDTGEFLYYDPRDGTWRSGAEDIIIKVLRESLPGKMTRYLEGEIIAEIKGTHYILSEFSANNGIYINCINGVLECSTMKLKPHDPDYHFRYVLPVKYNVRAKPNMILKYLEDATKDDLHKALKVLEFYAYCLIPGYPIQKAMTFLGNGSNGKSVALGLLSSFLGRRNIVSIPLQTIAYSRFAGAELRNKLANISGDVSGGELKDTSLFKMLTGGDYISAEMKMVQKRPLFQNSAKLIFAFNQLPRTADQTMAFFRRFEVVKFIQNFTGREDKQLIGKLTSEHEMSGLLNLLAGVFIPALLKKEQFHDSMTIEEIQLEYNLSADPALAFVQEHVQVDPDSLEIAEELYLKYTEWCKGLGLNISPPESFGYSLCNRAGIVVQKKRVQEEGIRRNYYVGIRYVNVIPVKKDEDKKCHSSIKTLETIRDALEYYVDEYYQDDQSGIGGIAFFTLTHERGWIHVKSQKTYDTSDTYGSYNGNIDKNQDTLLTIKQDFSVAWFDKDYHFHAQDLAHVPQGLASMLIDRGIGRPVNI